MCGIVGYIGNRDIESILMVGLERLSYRGYDSCGIGIMSAGEISIWKKSGKIHVLEKEMQNLTIKGTLGIGHTRWATHGEPNELNAHPIRSQNKRFAIVHNGIIENYGLLKTKLINEGCILRTQTDSEIIAHLIERYYSDDLVVAVEKAVSDIIGSFAIAVISENEPEKIVVTRKGSPLIIGIGDNENYISSDINSILNHTKQITYLEDNELGIITQENVTIKKLNGSVVEKKIETIKWDTVQSSKEGFPHFMLKEISEQPAVIRKILSKIINSNNTIHFKHLKMKNEELVNINRFIIQACGTSWHAGLIGKLYLEQFTRTLTEVDISSEFRYRHMIVSGKEVVIALSQSGETADTLACLREAKSKFYKVLSFVNVKNSSIDRESDDVIYTHAGPEIGVASTKNFIAQLLNLYLFTIHVGLLKWTISNKEAEKMIQAANYLPEYIENILNQSNIIKKIAQKYASSKNFLFIGRGVNYPTALEGALKLKEISYIHATGYAAGELKHGPIALIDKDMPVVCIGTQSHTYEKMISNIQEIKARKARTIIIATEGDKDIKKYADDIIYVPAISESLSPILTSIPLQLLAYYMAVKLECDVDQPRNLAKSVTVE